MTYELTQPLVFVDTETTQLEPLPKPWEIALIKRGGEVEEEQLHIMLRDPDLSDASPDALRVNRFYERHPRWNPAAHPIWNLTAEQDSPALMEAREAASAVELFTAGTQLVGSNPDFDARALDWLLRQHGRRPRWRHHTINLVTLSYPVLHARGEHVQIPSSSYDLSQRAGAEPPQKNLAHTAMGDALWTVRWWDSLMGAER